MQKLKIGAIVLAIIVASVLFVGGLAYKIHSDAYEEVYNRGRAAREDGIQIRSNPYIHPSHREVWRKGWREASEVKE